MPLLQAFLSLPDGLLVANGARLVTRVHGVPVDGPPRALGVVAVVVIVVAVVVNGAPHVTAATAGGAVGWTPQGRGQHGRA